MPERATVRNRTEKSAEAVVVETKPAQAESPGEVGSICLREGPNGGEGEAPASLEGTRHQKPSQLGLALETRGEAPHVQRSGEFPTATSGNGRPGSDRLMEEVVERVNAKAALKRVKQNKGSPGIDGMTVEELPAYLVKHWERVREELLSGSYKPQAVRRQQIPKSDGGVRELGIPIVASVCLLSRRRLESRLGC
jgi:hypothetical protein